MPNPGQPDRWLAEARAALEASIGGPPVGAVTVTVRDEGGNAVRFTRAEADARPAAVALSPLEERIVRAVCAAGVLTAKAIAARLGEANDGGFRAILANLCERRPAVLTSEHDGYRPVSPSAENDS